MPFAGSLSVTWSGELCLQLPDPPADWPRHERLETEEVEPAGLEESPHPALLLHPVPLVALPAEWRPLIGLNPLTYCALIGWDHQS